MKRVVAIWGCLSVLSGFAGAVCAQDWPWFYGPFGNASAVLSGTSLIEDITKARLVWRSQDTFPVARTADGASYPKGTEKGGEYNGISGGGSSVTKVGNRLYIGYYLPSGSAYDEAIVKRELAVGSWGPEKWSFSADDFVACVDATNGKTVWKARFRDVGYNWNFFNKGVPNLTPAIADGKVYAKGSAGKIYCLNASTGDTVWTSKLGRYDQLRAAVQKAIASGSATGTMGANRDLLGGMIAFDGMMVMNNEAGGVTAFDGGTGAKKWTVANCAGRYSVPYLWTAGGKKYVIAGSNYPYRTVCINPSDGEVVWEVAAGFVRHPSAAISDNYLVAATGSTDAGILTGFGISATGAKEIWKLSSDLASNSQLVTIHKDYAYSISQGKLTAIEIKTGKIDAQLAFDEGLDAGPWIAAMDGRIFAQASHDVGDVHMYKAAPGFSEMGRPWNVKLTLGYSQPSMPAFSSGLMYVRPKTGGIALYDLRNGASSIRPAAERSRAAGSVSRRLSVLDPGRVPVSRPNLGGRTVGISRKRSPLTFLIHRQ